MTIRATLLAIINILVLMVIITVGGVAFFTWEQWSSTRKTVSGVAMSSHILQAASAWAVERGLTNGAIAAENPVSSEQWNAIITARTNGDEAIDRAFHLLQSLSFASKAPLLSTLAEQRDKVMQLRKLVDHDLKLARQARSPALSAWFSTTSQAIDSALNLRLAVVQSEATSSTMAQVENIRSMLAIMVEFAGRERGYMNGIIAAKRAMNPQDLIILGEGNGNFIAAWHTIESLMRQERLDRELGEVHSTIQAVYFDHFGILRGQVFAASQSGSAYPVTPAEWFKAATIAMESLSNGQAQAGALLMRLLDEKLTKDRNILITALISLIVAIAIGFAGNRLVQRRIVQRLQTLHSVMIKLAEGNLDTTIPAGPSKDEVQQMSEAVSIFRDAMVRGKEMERIQQESHITREQHSQRVDQLTQEFSQSATALLEQVEQSVNQMQKLAESMTESAHNTQQQSAIVANASRGASESAHGGATATTSLIDAINNITGQVDQAASASQVANTEAQTASSIVSALDEAVQKISTVVGLISSIASQTNLLALNATIEAARAGEAGKGFAVVAGEVKNLANQTAKATDEIALQINAVQDSTHQVVEAISDIVTRITDINTISSSIAQGMEEQNATANSISQIIHGLNGNVQTMAQEIGSAEQSAKTTGESAQDVLIAVQEIRSRTEAMQQTVDRFLQAVSKA